MAEIESATFYIHYQNSNFSYVGSYYSVIKFNNFNIKECLGDMFDKYEQFKLVLTAYVNFNGTSISTSNRMLICKMSGLDWIGTHEYKTNNKSLATIGFLSGGNVGADNNQLTVNQGHIFNKPSNDTVNLTFYLQNLSTNGDTTVSLESSVFYFTIYGIIN